MLDIRIFIKVTHKSKNKIDFFSKNFKIANTETIVNIAQAIIQCLRRKLFIEIARKKIINKTFNFLNDKHSALNYFATNSCYNLRLWKFRVNLFILFFINI
jgi:hypothetical protein